MVCLCFSDSDISLLLKQINTVRFMVIKDHQEILSYPHCFTFWVHFIVVGSTTILKPSTTLH